jgi:pSer/pThr/pTyr-binding forkhead associated (FHA) protein
MSEKKQAELVVVKGEGRGAFVHVVEPVTIGRSSKASFTIEDTKASSIHAKVTPLESGVVILEDLGSTNGTYVNKERIEQTPLRSGDLIKIGRTLIVFRDEPAEIRLEDIELIGGGSSGAISGGASSHNVSSASIAALRSATGDAHLEQMLVAASEPSIARATDQILETVRKAVRAKRALLFLLKPLGRGVGLAQAAVAPGTVRDAPVQAEILQLAIQGEVVNQATVVAAPVIAIGRCLGAIYADGIEGTTRDMGALAAGAQLIGLISGLARSHQLVLASSEIVGLAQEQVQPQAVSLETILATRRSSRSSERLTARPGHLPLETALLPNLWVTADPNILSRGIDRLIEFVRTVARGTLRLVGDQREDTVRLLLRAQIKDTLAEEILDPAGVVADLLTSRERFETGQLAVARVAIMRGGARFTVTREGEDLVFLLELQTAERPA